MNKLFLGVALWLCCVTVISAVTITTVKWTWMAGSQKTSQPGQYRDTDNVTSTPGGRYGAVGVVDHLSERLWLFGGDAGLFFNDLWELRMKELKWTCSFGNETTNLVGFYGERNISNRQAYPGARRDAVGWYDSLRDEFWLFGGFGKGIFEFSGYLNDLWRYQVNDSIWTWMAGSHEYNKQGVYGEKGVADISNVPGARSDATGCYDSILQALWLFGGEKGENSFFNDLWRYRMSDSTWTWMSGSNFTNQEGVYGEKGIPNGTNVPGARRGAVGWFDSDTKEFWLFGGYSISGSGSSYLNDLWRYRVSDSTWTWISGSNTTNQRGVYGEKGKASEKNVPGARSYAVGWFDSNRKELWLFGGAFFQSYYNDLWVYRISDSTWTWVSGSEQTQQPGIYGKQGVVNSRNVPGAREYAVGWNVNVSRELWLFGGQGYAYDNNNNGVRGYLNDVWKGEIIEVECPPQHQYVDDTCVPLIQCSSACILQCDKAINSSSKTSPTPDESCVIEGDLVMNNNIVESNVVTIAGVINVRGDVTVRDQVKVALIPGSTLNVDNCLLLEEGSEIVVILNSIGDGESDGSDGGSSESIILTTYDSSCPELKGKVKVELPSSFDTCREARRPVVEEIVAEGGRTRLELVFVTVSGDSGDCESVRGSEVNLVAIAVTIPIVVVVVVVLIVVFAVPEIRMKVFPFARRRK